MSGGSGPSVVFAGCARDCEASLPAVLANVERAAARVGRSAVILVENDSKDGTKGLARRWAEGRPGAAVLDLDGLAARVPLRTARIAAARNAYLEHADAALRDFDLLAVFDCDGPNVPAWRLEGWDAALRHLEAHPEVSAVFAASDPVYYDIWALRHPGWCPGDCWREIAEDRREPPAVAVERYVYSRQLDLPASGAPIQVQSAFNGLGLYRLGPALSGRYVGLGPQGEEVCEHVAFNAQVGRHGELHILPALRTAAPAEHLRPRPAGR